MKCRYDRKTKCERADEFRLYFLAPELRLESKISLPCDNSCYVREHVERGETGGSQGFLRAKMHEKH
jgi:hypothetical protein